MPYSSNSGKEFIKSLNLQGKSILDVGCGSGTYKDLFPNLGEHWTGIEIWEPYVEKYGLKNKYDELIVADIRDYELTKNYDICFCGDILEHMTEDQAVKVLDKLKKHCIKVIVSIPLGHYPQDEWDNNPYEVHVEDNWSHERVSQVFGRYKNHFIDNEIGVYVYEKLKIAVYAISKNEDQFVERFMRSCANADLVIIGDTGSSDDTVKLAREMGAVVPEICISPWRFDKARDAVLALIPRDFDVCISLDLDEILEDGWREEIERVWTENTTRLRYKFDWGCGISFFYEKIHHRHGYHWHHPVHEYPVPDGRIQEIYAHTDKLLVSHHPDPTKSRGQYMPLLELAVTEDPKCPRNAFYFARELTFHGRWQESIGALNKYLAMPEANWANERCYAMRLLGKAYEEMSNYWEALAWYRKACAESPVTREPWCDLAMFCYRNNNWNECLFASEQALAITNKQEVYTMDPSVWTEKPYDLASIASWHLGKKDQAIQFCKEALKFNPTDVRLLNNLQSMETV